MRSSLFRKYSQRGSALIVSLLILLVMTIIGVTAMSTTTLEEKMAGNIRDQNIAFQAAEAALRDAEKDVIENNIATTLFDAACTNGLCLPAAGAPQWDAVSWASGSVTSREYGSATAAAALGGVAQPPRYIVEMLDEIPQPNSSIAIGIKPGATGTAFRITALGYGANASTTVMLQAVVVRL